MPPSTSRADEHDRAQRAPAPLAPREQAVDEQPQRAAELLARARLGQLERLAQQLAGPARAQRRVAPAREVVRQQARAPEAIGDGGARQRGELAERRDPQPLERLDERGGLGAAAQQRDRPRGEIPGSGDPRRPADAGAAGRDHRAEARRPLPDPRARQHPAQRDSEPCPAR